MTATRLSKVRKLRRQILMLRLMTLSLPFLAFGFGGLAVHLSLQDGPGQCLKEVNSFVKGVESSLPSDPVRVDLVVRGVTDAAGFCGKGERGNAQEVLETLRESLRV